MKPLSQARGERGEDLAESHLVRHGYRIRERSLRVGRAQVDLVVEKEGLLVAVEVKLRSTDAFGPPESFVDEGQQHRIRAAIEEYLHQIDWLGEVRFDVIAIERTAGGHRLTHFEDAF